MATTSRIKPYKSILKFVLTFLMHQFIGTFGVTVLTLMFTTIAFVFPNPWSHTLNMYEVSGVLAGTPYFPAQIVVALLFGWLISDLFGHESMLWIWVLPYASLIYDFARLPAVSRMAFEARFSYFFGWGCRPENHCMDQLGVTLPFYAAVAYSIGALLARKLPMRCLATRRKISVLIFAAGVLFLADEVAAFVFYFKGLLAKVPPGWGWIILPAAVVLDTGIGVSLILIALKFRRLRRDFGARAPLGS